MVKPISLRVHQTAVTVRARELLRELDEKDKQRRRVRWQATKALVSIREMVSLMSATDRELCRVEYERAKSFLEKISGRGV